MNSQAAIPAFHYSPLWHLLGWGLLVTVVYLSLISNPPEILEFAFADKLEHLLAYAVLMGWFGQLYVTGARQLGWAAGMCLLGVGLEFAQGWGGVRFFDVWDMAANATGVLLGWWLTRGVFAGFLQRVDNALSHVFGALS